MGDGEVLLTEEECRRVLDVFRNERDLHMESADSTEDVDNKGLDDDELASAVCANTAILTSTSTSR